MFQKLLKKVAAALDKAGIPYMVIGGQAVLIYGEPRLTKDIDITLGVNIDGLDKIRGVARDLGLKPLVDDLDSFVGETMVFPALDEKSGIRVDFIFSFSGYEREAIRRAVGIRLGRSEVKFATLEDVVIHKIAAGRARDMEDIVSILLKNHDYDAAYIEKWLMEFDTALGKDFQNQFRVLAESVIN